MSSGSVQAISAAAIVPVVADIHLYPQDRIVATGIPQVWRRDLRLAQNRRIGEGGFGSLFLVHHPGNASRRLVWKRAKHDNRGTVRQMENEIAHLEKLHNIAIVKMEYKVCEPLLGPTGYLMKQAGRGSLFHFIKALLQPLDQNLKNQMAYQIYSALHYLHLVADVIHSDLNPNNILVDHNLNVLLTISDFGSATKFGSCWPHSGTDPFRSKEQHLGETYGPEADIHGYAMTLVPFENRRDRGVERSERYRRVARLMHGIDGGEPRRPRIRAEEFGVLREIVVNCWSPQARCTIIQLEENFHERITQGVFPM